MKRSESEFENIQTDDTIDGAYLSTNELQYPLTKQIQCIHKGLLLNLFRRKKKRVRWLSIWKHWETNIWNNVGDSGSNYLTFTPLLMLQTPVPLHMGAAWASRKLTIQDMPRGFKILGEGDVVPTSSMASFFNPSQWYGAGEWYVPGRL